MGGMQAMRFGASPVACKQSMSLGFTWSKQRLSGAALEDMQRIQQHGQEHMQKVVGPEAAIVMFPYVTL